jgi:glutamate-1-semialdehyde 2,1-aminomutase
MAAGLATLEHAAANDVYDRVNALGDRLRSGIADLCEDRAPQYTVVGRDSMFKTVFTRDAPPSFDDHCGSGCRQREACPRYDRCPKTGGDVESAASERWDRLFRPAMRDEGILLTANQNESQFVSDAHTDADVEETLETYKTVL